MLFCGVDFAGGLLLLYCWISCGGDFVCWLGWGWVLVLTLLLVCLSLGCLGFNWFDYLATFGVLCYYLLVLGCYWLGCLLVLFRSVIYILLLDTFGFVLGGCLCWKCFVDLGGFCCVYVFLTCSVVVCDLEVCVFVICCLIVCFKVDCCGCLLWMFVVCWLLLVQLLFCVCCLFLLFNDVVAFVYCV